MQTRKLMAVINAAVGKSGKDTTFGWGRVDAFDAVNYVAS